MKYFLLGHSIEPREVGITFPQSQSTRESVTVDSPRHLWKQPFGFLKDVVLPEPIVHHTAKLTDLLSNTATWRLVMSAKLKLILERFIMEGQCQFLAMTVHDSSKHYQYWMLNPLVFNMENIDFGASETWLCTAGDTLLRKLDIDSLNQFEEFSKQLQMPERVCLRNISFIPESRLDYIQLRNAPGIFYVSEKLRNEIIKEGCTGIEFKEV